MAKSKYNEAHIDDSGKWNIAKKYSETKILKPLEIIDKYEIVARFGFSSIEEKLEGKNLDKQQLNYLRLEAFEFLIAYLIQLIGNCDFSINQDRDAYNKYLNKIILIRDEFINEVAIKKPNNRAIIKEEEYLVLLDFINNIKSKLNFPLNKNNLIFASKVEENYEEMIQADEDEFINEP